MRSLKKLLAVLVALTLMVSVFAVPAFAAESFDYEDEAKALYDLGLFKGTSTTEYKPALDARLERQEGAVLVLRLFGLEEEANKLSEADAKAILAGKFSDADEVGAWAVKAIAYAVQNGIIDGRPDGKFAPKDPLLGKEFAKMILAKLGQDYDFQTACADLASVSGMTAAEAIKFNDKILIRDDVVGISFGSLEATYKDSGKTVLAVLSEGNATLKAKALELGLIKIVKINTVVEAINIKVGETVQLPAKAEVEYSDGSVAEVALTWDSSAVKTDVAGEYKAIGSVAGFDGKIEAAITVTPDVLAVESVTADNLKEIVVVFNQDVSENAEVAKKDNYTLDISGTKVSAVKVDGDTVVLTVDKNADNQKKAKLTVAAKILPEKEVFDFTFFDGTLPEVLGIEVTGPKSVNIKFSEPIAKYGKITLKSGNSTLSVNPNYTGIDTATITAPLHSSFADGKTYEITIKDFEDYAEYKNVIKTIEFVYEKDTTAPVATIASVDQKYVKITFNKPVKGLTPKHFSHTFTAWEAISLTTADTFKAYDSGDTTVVTATKSVKEVYVWFHGSGKKDEERPIPEGSTSFRMRVKNSDDVEIKDEWGNKIEELNTTIEVKADKTAPEVSSVTVTEEDVIKVVFSKTVVKPTTDNIEVLDADGKKIDGVKLTITGSGKEYLVNLGKKLAGKTIIVNIKNVEDTSLSANKMADYTTTIDITDKTKPEVSSITYERKNDSAGKFVEAYLNVFYSESMDSDSALNISNYFIFDGTDYIKLSKSASFFSGEKIVKVVLTEKESDKIKAIEIKPGQGIFITGVKDVAGNEIAPKVNGIKGAQADTNYPAIYIKDNVKQLPKATDADKIEVLFNQELDSISSGAFTVKAGSTEYKISELSTALDGGRTKVILTIEDSKLPYDLIDNGNAVTLTVKGSMITNLFGDKGNDTDDVNVAISDKIAPAFKEAEAGSVDKTIVLTFKEKIKYENVASFAHDFVVTYVEDNKVLVPQVDYEVKLDGNADSAKLIIDLKSYGKYGKYSIKFKDTVNYIKDLKGNVAAKFDEKTVEIKDLKPAVVTAITAQIAKSGEATATATVEFSKELDAASKTIVETAITSATTAGTLTYTWAKEKLTVTNTHATDATNFAAGEVKVTVTDEAGNVGTDLIIINIPAVNP